MERSLLFGPFMCRKFSFCVEKHWIILPRNLNKKWKYLKTSYSPLELGLIKTSFRSA